MKDASFVIIVKNVFTIGRVWRYDFYFSRKETRLCIANNDNVGTLGHRIAIYRCWRWVIIVFQSLFRWLYIIYAIYSR